ncbi:MAG: hypothetical protein E6R12_13300 [Sphingomonadales bacterium]|nr:MAG: hypothetical protein E6R12_13300 [Sphingomonadales bacterium]
MPAAFAERQGRAVRILGVLEVFSQHDRGNCKAICLRLIADGQEFKLFEDLGTEVTVPSLKHLKQALRAAVPSDSNCLEVCRWALGGAIRSACSRRWKCRFNHSISKPAGRGQRISCRSAVSMRSS